MFEPVPFSTFVATMILSPLIPVTTTLVRALIIPVICVSLDSVPADRLVIFVCAAPERVVRSVLDATPLELSVNVDCFACFLYRSVNHNFGHSTAGEWNHNVTVLGPYGSCTNGG